MIVVMSPIMRSDAESVEQSRRASSCAGRAEDARRARLIVLLPSGDTWAAIRSKPACNDAFIDQWSKRFAEERVAALFSRLG
jgi:hypothetical protein